MTEETIAAINALLDDLDCDLRAMTSEQTIAHTRAVALVHIRSGAIAARTYQAFDETGDWANTGAHSVANFLTAQTGTSTANAGGQVNVGRKLTKMPLAADAYAAADITEPHVRQLMRCVGPRTIERFTVDEAMLVDDARKLPADVFRVVVDRWLLYADPDGNKPGDDENFFDIAKTAGGRVKGKFDLGPEVGEETLNAIMERYDQIFTRDRKNNEIDPTDPGLTRPPSQRRAQAFAELIGAGSTATCPKGVRRPAFNIVINPAMVAAIEAGETPGPDAEATLLDGSVIPHGLVQRWLCDSYVARVMQEAPSVLLDLGHEVRFPNDELRKAVIIRDRHCVVPGCDRPANWCDAHHVAWWDRDHGPTAIDNLVLMCRWHHTRIHQGHLHVRIIDGTPEVSLADGTLLVNPRPRGPDQVQAA